MVGIYVSHKAVYASYTFLTNVHYPDSYMNDARFDLRPDVPGRRGQRIAYIVDSSEERRPAFIMLDLGTGKSWQRLTQHPSVLRVYNNVPSYQGHSFYLGMAKMPISH
jgi:hypothetical protein